MAGLRKKLRTNNANDDDRNEDARDDDDRNNEDRMVDRLAAWLGIVGSGKREAEFLS
jgi:hypothetical protein